ncbi:membrane metallo-endopeptidase-like 1 [Panulirus ornatus]|uniref:membrane metallo-endopeptidase-like 1 n=1 Tax=Panulirus ornatus TaxID=150431 RepID=UPI003A895A31
MTSLREHIELKEHGFVEVPIRGQQQPPRSDGVQMPCRWTILPIVCAVVIVASVVATLAVVLPGQSQSSQKASIQQENQPNPVRANLGGPIAGAGIFQQLAQRIEEIEAENALKHEEEKAAEETEADAHPVDPNFVKEDVPLENLSEHDMGQILPLVHHQNRQEIPIHPDFEQVTVMLEGSMQQEAVLAHLTKESLTKQEIPPANTKSGSPTLPAGTPYSPGAQEEVLELREEVGKVNIKESEEVEEKRHRESTRLPTTRLDNGRRICETPECAMAAQRISESLDLSADPCDNFYQFACGGWIDKHPIPPGMDETGTFLEAMSNLDNHLKLILDTTEEPDAPQPVHMAHTFYKTCMDTDTMDSLGMAPLASSLARQGGWPMVLDDWDDSTFSLTTALADLRLLNVYPLVAVGVDLDLTNVSRRIIYIDAGQVPLGVKLMANPSDSFVKTYITFMSEAARQLRDHLGSSVSDEDIDHQVKQVIDFEVIFSKMVLYAVAETTDTMWYTDVSGIQSDTDAGTPGQFDWLVYLKKLFNGTGVTITKEEPVISFKGTFFSEFTKLLAATDTRILANAMGWWWAFELQEETTYAMRNASYLFQQGLTGRDTPYRRWWECMTQTNYNLGFALSREYVDQYMDASTKPEMTELVENMRNAFNTLLDNNTWMLPEDLVMAREKLMAIDPFVAYPDWIMDDTQLTMGYEDLEISNGKQVENLESIGAWFELHSFASLRETPEHSFLFPPTVVNAFYNAQENTITILAGILQPPFYSHNSLAALNYGGIGMVIGHEITHGFDNIGMFFDKDGNLAQWWSNATAEAYIDHAQCFINQYNGFIPPELTEVGLNISINGVQTEGENIADNGGIREAFRAYQLFVEHYGEEARLPGLDEYDPDQLFYLGFANGWCEHKDAQAVLAQLVVDAHSPGRFRVLGPLYNDEEFSKVWNCPAGSPMNHGEDRCLLW